MIKINIVGTNWKVSILKRENYNNKCGKISFGTTNSLKKEIYIKEILYKKNDLTVVVFKSAMINCFAHEIGHAIANEINFGSFEIEEDWAEMAQISFKIISKYLPLFKKELLKIKIKKEIKEK